MHSQTLFLLASLAFSLTAASSASTKRVSLAPVIDLGYAQYQGATNVTNNITTFFGLRYASPPTGSLRFQAPEKPAKIAGIQNATVVPSECFQGSTGGAATNPLLPLSRRAEADIVVQSEDCLFLDVAVPNVETAKDLPVLVWIHGGGYVYVSGSAGDSPYDLTVDSDNRAITVFIQYRLGAFGFLAGPEVKKRGALNAGLLDQHLALQWVQEHISKFGGDPAKVTIWGESGAGSVLQHIVANGGHTEPPLFRAAMTSSTFLPSQYPGDSLIPTMIYNRVANLTGCGNATDSFACLVAVDAEAFEAINTEVSLEGFIGTFVFVPVIDGEFIVERPTLTLKRGDVNGEVLLAITNTFEGRVFVTTTVTNTTAYAQDVFPLLDANQMEAVAAQYSVLNGTLPTAYDQAIGIMGESIFICPTYFLLQAFKGRSWKGEFAIPPGNHGDDVPYYFISWVHLLRGDFIIIYNFFPSRNDRTWDNLDFVASFSGSFLDVAVSLDPNNKFDSENTTPEWNKWIDNSTEMLFNRTATLEPDIRAITTDPGLLERCAYISRRAAFWFCGRCDAHFVEPSESRTRSFHHHLSSICGPVAARIRFDPTRGIVDREMHSQTLFILASLAFSLTAASASPKGIFVAPVVDLGYAQYQGTTNVTNNITSFFGLRYASPPTGSLRFQAPEKPAKIAGIQNATVVPSECFQGSTGGAASNPLLLSSRQAPSNNPTQSEDCLFLDVNVPNMETAKDLPVLVWIHGGGYAEGSAGYSPYDLTVDSGNRVITVFIQYRLGAFGFLAGPEVKKRGALNAGLLDQHFALQWVQEHVSALTLIKFGGDPAKVTIWGESEQPCSLTYLAGAGSVLQHIVANGGRTEPPLFRAAMTSSTFLPSQYPGDSLIPTTIYNRVANLTGCGNAADSFACLVAVDADALQAINVEVSLEGFTGTFVFVPVIDGEFIVERPTLTLKRGDVNGEVLLAVTNTFEGRVFTTTAVTNTTAYAQDVFPLLDANQIDAVAAQYAVLNGTLPTAYDQAIGIMGESIFICPTYFLLQAFKGKSWKGEFAIPPGNHGDDSPYYFTSIASTWENIDFIASFSGSFLDVVVSLDPNRKFDSENTTPAWNLWIDNSTEMLFNRTAALEPDIRAITTDPGLLERCA
ncbi:alpha/beta-hydrolase [Athelia psychrophila]|uniref:Alpha/beta-hydrolase n=1 Tax=Athelia psychrophila TaxID=1759441 RepID=A0A166PUU7_9AGAM|nr:alpha/beta-hydrolase [Fibularhizoctonia sp. CBS 109695]